MHVMTVHFLCLQEQEVSLEAELARLEDEVAALDWGAPGKALQATVSFLWGPTEGALGCCCLPGPVNLHCWLDCCIWLALTACRACFGQ